MLLLFLGKDHFNVAVRAGDYMYAIEIADSLCSCCACFNRSLNSTDVAAYHNGNKTGTDLFFAHKGNVCSFYHCISSFDCADETLVSTMPNACFSMIISFFTILRYSRL